MESCLKQQRNMERLAWGMFLEVHFLCLRHQVLPIAKLNENHGVGWMTIVYAYLGVSLAFALLIALGSREKRNVLSRGGAFYYQRTILVAIGSSGFMWILLSVATLWLAFPDGEIAPGPLAAYVIVNAFVVIAIFCIYKWYRMYSVEIADNLIVRSFGGVREISFDSITKAEIIDGKDTTRMVIFWGYPKQKKACFVRASY